MIWIIHFKEVLIIINRTNKTIDWGTLIEFYVANSTLAHLIDRLNSGIRNRHNFFLRAIFLLLKVGNESVNHADSRDIKIFVEVRGNSILKISLRFWNCVGCGHMRGCIVITSKICKDFPREIFTLNY